MTTRIEGWGHKGSLMAFVGHMATKDDEKFGRPFMGRSGKLLERCAAQAGITLKLCYLTYLHKNFPFKKESSALEELFAELENTNVNIIVAVGKEAFEALTREVGTKILKVRGSVYQVKINSKTFKLIPILDPSDALNQFDDSKTGNYTQLIILDLKKAAKESVYPELLSPKRKFTTCLSSAEQFETLKYLNTAEYLSVDIETVGSTISCIGFAPKIDEAFCFPFYHGRDWIHSEETHAKIWTEISRLLHREDIKKVGQNLLYDYTIMGRLYNIEPVNIWCDTMITHHICYMDMLKGLDFLASIYTKEPYWKDEGKQWKDVKDWQMFWDYNMKDASVTLEIAFELQKHVKQLGVENVVRQYHDLTFGPIIKASLHGTRIDTEYLDNYKEHCEELLEKLHKKFKTLCGDVNPLSPKQVAKLLYETIHFDLVTSKKETDEDALLKLIIKIPQLVEILERKVRRKEIPSHLTAKQLEQVLQIILSIRGLQKLLSTYIEIQLDNETRRLHTSYNPCGTTTGRLSSSKAPWGVGGNLQNPPRKDTEADLFQKIQQILED